MSRHGNFMSVLATNTSSRKNVRSMSMSMQIQLSSSLSERGIRMKDRFEQVATLEGFAGGYMISTAKLSAK